MTTRKKRIRGPRVTLIVSFACGCFQCPGAHNAGKNAVAIGPSAWLPTPGASRPRLGTRRDAQKRSYARQRTEPHTDMAYFRAATPAGRLFVQVSCFRHTIKRNSHEAF